MKKIPKPPAHSTPKGLWFALKVASALEAWKDLTPLARNEWIC